MCLFAKDAEPRVATTDIKVYKHVLSFDKVTKKAVTKYQETIFDLDKEFLPQGKVAPKTTVFTFGVIHACLWPDFDRGTCLEAYIPEGTNYWIGVDGCTVCAEKLFVTSKEVTEPACMDINLAREILAEAPAHEGHTVGEFTSDDYMVVGFYPDGKPMIADIANMIKDMAIDTCHDSRIDKYYSYDKAAKDFDGVSHFKNHPKGGCYEAYNAVVKLGPKHYIPACGEMRTLLSNILYIASSCTIKEMPISISTEGWYWTSSEGSLNYSWHCGIIPWGIDQAWDYKDCRNRVVPFVAPNPIANTENKLITALMNRRFSKEKR